MNRVAAPLSALGVVALATCTPKPYVPYDPATGVWTTPTPAGECGTDGDCLVSDFSGCCTCCPGTPRVFSARALTALRRDCAVVTCVCSPDIQCSRSDAGSAPAIVATCREGACNAEPR